MLARPEYGSRLHILAWLEQQDPDAEFCWDETTTCAVARYCAAFGKPNAFNGNFPRNYPRNLHVMNNVAGEISKPRTKRSVISYGTFGALKAALEREWLCAST